MLLIQNHFLVVTVDWLDNYDMMEIVDTVDSIKSVLVDNNMFVFVAVDNYIDRSRKRTKSS